jgi:predicted metalloprotease with PDZ domain
MNRFKSLVFVFLVLFISGFLNTVETDAQTTRHPEISYTVSMSKPWTHLLEVEMRMTFDRAQRDVEIVMPVWTPGSYLVREYARHVQDFSAINGAGNDLKWTKVNKNSWRINANGAREVIARYNVYSNELTVRTNELNSQHAFFNPTATLMHPRGHIKAPSTVTVNPYGNWKVATGLRRVDGKENTFRAADFDILYDSPFEVSDFKEISFEVLGKMHRYVITGDGNYDLQRLATDTAKIVEESYKIFGELPYEDYLIIVNTRGRGGLEHLNSTALQWNRNGFTGANYIGFLNLVAHEFFHLWNVKRIKPDVLGPFDYENENYTNLLWVAEGLTSYYESVILRRAGLISEREFFSIKASAMQALQERPGRFQTSLEEASFDAWIKYYRQDENSVNNQISYYDKGEIVGFLLDVEIRSRSNGKHSMDDVFRELNTEFAKKNRNFTPSDFKRLCEKYAGGSLSDFFAKYIEGREEIDYNETLNKMGLQLMTHNPGSSEIAFFGADVTQQGERLNVARVYAGSPAQNGGLNFNDQIIAFDGFRASQGAWQSFLNERKPGDKVKLTVFRFDEIKEIEVTLTGRMRPDFRIVKSAGANETHSRLYREYVNAELR